jgi:GT2 family glycosyltransferase
MDTTPLFSVIVPTRDRPERLAACLDALARVEFAPERFEAVVSDDGSTKGGERRVGLALRVLGAGIAIRHARGSGVGVADSRWSASREGRGQSGLPFALTGPLPPSGLRFVGRVQHSRAHRSACSGESAPADPLRGRYPRVRYHWAMRWIASGTLTLGA